MQGCKSIPRGAEIAQAHRNIETEPANWKPLEKRIGRRCGEFMWMFRQNGLEYYKHIDTRRYLILDQKGSVTAKREINWSEPDSGRNSELLQGLFEMLIEWISTVGAGCAFLLAVAYGITTRRGMLLMVAGIISLWLPALTRTLTVEMATEKPRIEQHESSRAERRAGGS